jgi:hypothetical protein
LVSTIPCAARSVWSIDFSRSLGKSFLVEDDCEQSHARAPGTRFSRSLLRSAKFLLENRAALRNAMRTNLPLVSSEKHAAQPPEKLRKSFSLN